MKQTIKRVTPIKGFRDWLAHQLVRLAYWVKPDNEDGKAYLLDLMMESELENMKYGTSVLDIKVRKHKED